MKPSSFAAMNVVYRDGEKFSGTEMVPVFRDEETETCTTVWELSEEDRGKIFSGAKIVAIMDGEQAPICLQVLEGL